MNIQVRYHSRSGNTAKVAQAIAEAAGVKALPISEPLAMPVDLLFIGGGMYAGKADKALAAFIGGLDQGVKRAAVFSTSCSGQAVQEELKSLLQARGIQVLPGHFVCTGKFLFMRLRNPDAGDLKNAADFARSAIAQLQG